MACVDVRGDVRDLLIGELAGERRHRAHALRDAGHDELVVRLGVVEIRADGAGRAGVREGVAADAAGAREDGLAGGRVARELQGGKVARVRRCGRQRADDGLRSGGRLGAVEAAGAEQAERKREQNEANDSGSGASRLGV